MQAEEKESNDQECGPTHYLLPRHTNSVARALLLREVSLVLEGEDLPIRREVFKRGARLPGVCAWAPVFGVS